MKNKVETTVAIDFQSDCEYQLAIFLRALDIEDIIDKYNLNMNKNEMKDVLQHLFDKLCCELELEM